MLLFEELFRNNGNIKNVYCIFNIMFSDNTCYIFPNTNYKFNTKKYSIRFVHLFTLFTHKSPFLGNCKNKFISVKISL